MSGQQPLNLNLSDDERLVLFDMLGRLIEDENGRRLTGLGLHDAEIWALNSLYCELERTQVAPFKTGYPAAVQAARSNVLQVNGGRWPRPEGQ